MSKSSFEIINSFTLVIGGKLVELSWKGKFYLGLQHLKALQTEIHLERNSLTKIDKQKPQLKDQEMRKGSI